MQSHRDADATRRQEYFDALKQKAEEMTARKENLITAGKPGEKELFAQQVGLIFVRRLPDDPLALRISIGEARDVEESAYLVFRGDPEWVMELLDRAVSAMRAAF